LLLEPVIVTTGVTPRRPQVRPLGGLKPWPDSSSKTSQAPRSAAVLLWLFQCFRGSSVAGYVCVWWAW
jgi:hypothetical protein